MERGSMSPAALSSAIELVTGPAHDVLAAHLSEHGFEFDGIVWVLSTALMVEALKAARGNKARAAKMLGMKRNFLNHQISERHLEPVIEKALAAVKFAEHIQPTLFPERKPSTSAHPFVLKFCRAANVIEG
jgi:hypothetical protein